MKPGTLTGGVDERCEEEDDATEAGPRTMPKAPKVQEDAVPPRKKLRTARGGAPVSRARRLDSVRATTVTAGRVPGRA